MCKAFSCVCPEKGSVIWKLGVDSHEKLLECTNLKDFTCNPAYMTFARIEITPINNDYRKSLKTFADSEWTNPNDWRFKIDELAIPTWWNEAYKQSCWDAHKSWCKQLYDILDCKTEIANPFTVVPPKKIGKKHIRLLKRWASVWDSVGASIWASVWASIWDSVGASIWDSVGDSVEDSVGASIWDSVGASIWARYGGLYKTRTKKYPFKSCVDLWEAGLVPTFDGKIWRLHGGTGARVLFEISAEDLRNFK